MASGGWAFSRIVQMAVGVVVLLAAARGHAAAPFPGNGYCSAPPVAGSTVKPNVLLMLDNSGSMYELAYSDPAVNCIDDSYDDSKAYPGYFDQGAFYLGSSTKFTVSAQTLPAGCNTVNGSFLCVNIDSSSGAVDRFIASGKFLNWLIMSKLDMEKSVLTGGKFLKDIGSKVVTGSLIPESRGCMGNRFVKLVKAFPQVTFAVRGPGITDLDYRYAFYAGETRVEIYNKKYNKEACLAALQTAQQQPLPDVETLRQKGYDCIGQDNLWQPGGVVPAEGKIFVDLMSACYAFNADPKVKVADGVVLGDCTARYGGSNRAPTAGAGDVICADGIVHGIAVSNSGYETTGWLGKCLKTAGDLDPECAEQQGEEYCRELTGRVITDPSTGNMPAANANLPSYLLDSGILGLGSAAGVFKSRVAVPAAPSTGLIQEYANEVNFAAMVFNDTGAGSAECKHEEITLTNGGFVYGDLPCDKRCTGTFPDAGFACHTAKECAVSCAEITPADGGKVISAINAPVGDHSSGLIKAIDQIVPKAWTPLAESFYNAMGYFAGRSDLRLQSADFVATQFPSQFTCQRNNVLLITDGTSTADRRSEVMTLVANAVAAWGNDPENPIPASKTTISATDASPPFKGSYNIDDLAWIARNKNITNFNNHVSYNREYISTYVLYTGPSCGDYNPDGSCRTTDESIPEKMMQLTAAKGGGNIASARDPAQLEEAMRKLLQQITSGSGSDAAILSTGDGNGAIFLQEQYVPTRNSVTGPASASWIGEMQALWYYIDPFTGKSPGAGSTIREDSDGDSSLNLGKDKMVSFRYDSASNRTYAYLSADTTGSGVRDVPETRVEVDQVKGLWRAGRQLWLRDVSVSARDIYTPLLTGGEPVPGTGLMKAVPEAAAVVGRYLNLATGDPDAGKLLRYLQGYDFPGDPTMRGRTLFMDGTPATASAPGSTGVGVWKLGDIVSSTPQSQTQVPLGAYHLPPPKGYGDASYLSYIRSAAYQGRGTVYVGANDGMLHAFKLGQLDTSEARDGVRATLAGSGLGAEQWAFIPKNALPYLKYLADPRYKHLFFVDGKVTLVDASVAAEQGGSCGQGSYWSCPRSAASWRTVLVGGMGLGGAPAESCDGVTTTNCVATPAPDPDAPSKRTGYSSYFALDVTDPANPVFLWEFSDAALGYSTSGPAIVRIGDPGLNGRWFAVFGSGPTGPIETVKHQFLARSNQKLQLFVVDLYSGKLLAVLDPGVNYGFAGAATGGGVDVDKATGSGADSNHTPYQDDAIYLGYTRSNSDSIGADTKWNSGGVLRVLTDGKQDPLQWKTSKVIEGIGPVTTGVAKLQDKKYHNLWLYFGTGRYFFSQDDMQDGRALYGVKEPCYNHKSGSAISVPDVMDAGCGAAVIAGDLSDQTGEHPMSGEPGWLINLFPAATGVGAERLVTTPTSVTAGAVFFTTFQPSTDLCQFGDSYLWEVKYDTGGSVSGVINGKVVMQSPTVSVEESTLPGTARRGPAMGGPGKPLPITNSGLRPLRKIIHIQER